MEVIKTKYVHYGIEVVYQQLMNCSFRDELKKSGIKYTDLPLLENDVLVYTLDGKTKYACITCRPGIECSIENVYLTDTVPLDMSWSNLILDCEQQRKGEQPMLPKTKAKVICDKALEIAENHMSTNADSIDVLEVTPQEFRLAVIHMGYDPQELLEMDHWDVDDDFLKEMITG